MEIGAEMNRPIRGRLIWRGIGRRRCRSQAIIVAKYGTKERHRTTARTERHKAHMQIQEGVPTSPSIKKWGTEVPGARFVGRDQYGQEKGRSIWMFSSYAC